MEEFVPLPQLADPDGYRPTTFDYDPPPGSKDPRGGIPPGKSEWVEVFRKSIDSFRKRAASDPRVPDAASLADRFADDFGAALDRINAGDHADLFEGEPTVLKMCRLRDEALRSLGFADCFQDVKAKENEQALTVLPGVLAEIDAITNAKDRLLALIQGAFAGNIFDLGAAASAKLHEDGGGDFRSTRAALKPRPWLVDDFDALYASWTADGAPGGELASAWRKCVMFVDNSGADVVLGMLPIARELARRGCKVVIAANETPSINDVTASELTSDLIPRVCDLDDVFAEAVRCGAITVCSSGSDLPVIDLRRVSQRLGKSCGGCRSGHPRGNGPSRGDEPGGGVRLRRAQDRHGETPGGGSVPRRGAVRLRVQVRGCGVFMIVRCVRILMQASLH